jgi:hypothetical protein
MIAKNEMELLSLFTTLSAELKKHGARVAYKDEWWWKFTTKAHRGRVSLIGEKITYPDRDWVNESPIRAIGMLCHEFIHFIDREKDGLKYWFRYWLSKMWRRKYEMRGYVSNLLIGLLYARPSEDVFDKLATIMTKPIYFGMFKNHRDAVIEAKIGYSYVAAIAHELLERQGCDERKLDMLLAKDEVYSSPGLRVIVDFLVNYIRNKE